MLERIEGPYNLALQRVHQILEEDGLAGVVAVMEELSQKNWFYKGLCNLDEKLIGIRPLLTYLVHLDQQIPNLGTQGATQEFLANIGITIKMEQERRQWMLEEGMSVLAFGVSHGTTIEPFAMAALLKRQDITFIGVKTMGYLGENSTPYLLSVMPRRYAKDREASGLKDRFDLSRNLYRAEELSLEEIERLNEEALIKAAEKLAQGGIIVIFPPGGFSIESKWRRGIGRIIGKALELPESDLTDIILAPFHFSGLSKRDIFLAARQAYAGKKRQRSIKVHIGSEFTLDELIAGLGNQPSPEEITEFLRERSLSERAARL